MGSTAAIGVPRNAQVVEARGKYLVPGFWDMHSHVDDNVEQLYPRFLANGVTGTREMAQRGQFPDSFRVWQREVMKGKRVGPRSYGPSADLTEGSGITIGTPEDAVRVIDSLKAAGDAFAKYHGAPDDPPVYFAIVREARKVGLPIAGHLLTTVPDTQAVDSGQGGVEHIIREYACVQRPDKEPLPKDELQQECAAVARAYLRNGTWLTPTITIDFYRYFVGSESAIGGADPQVFLDYQEYLRTLYRLGVRNFMTGTDCPVDGDQTCGLTLLQEMVLLGETGLPAVDVLRAATLHPAQYMKGTDSLGTVAPAKLADLVLLDADPLADIHNVLKIRAVVANGRYFDRAALDAMDPDAVKTSAEFAAGWNGSKRIAR